MPPDGRNGKRNPGKEHPAFKASQWKPGQSGNPAGPTGRKSFEAIVAMVLDEKVPGAEIRKREALARVFVDQMLKRDGAMIKAFLDREWPAMRLHDVSITDTDHAGLLDELAAVAARRGTDGSGNGVDHSAEEGAG